MATLSKKEAQERDLKAILAKDIGASNPIFSPGHLAELHAVFSLFADNRQRRTDIRDILLTATELGLDTKYDMAIRVLTEINESANGNALDFESFVKELTNRIVIMRLSQGNPFTEEGRKATFNLIDYEGKGELDFKDLRYLNDQLKYGYNEEQLVDIIHAVGGYNAETISFDKFNSYVRRKVNRTKAELNK
jgi:Ca2+-binding EF-hand superfamily protein